MNRQRMAARVSSTSRLFVQVTFSSGQRQRNFKDLRFHSSGYPNPLDVNSYLGPAGFPQARVSALWLKTTSESHS
jgi:hypothetical protein